MDGIGGCISVTKVDRPIKKIGPRRNTREGDLKRRVRLLREKCEANKAEEVARDQLQNEEKTRLKQLEHERKRCFEREIKEFERRSL